MICINDYMKKIIFFLLLLIFSVTVSAQKKQPKDTTKYEYRLEKSIPYRDAKAEKLDDYAIKNCQLDFYYPVNKKAFATLVWIHGGSLKGGKK